MDFLKGKLYYSQIMGKIYLDNAAGTPCDKRVVKAMKRFWARDFGNPSSIHSLGVSAKVAIEKARNIVADFLHAHSREIIFTSGGTEANNLAIFGIVRKAKETKKKIHLITTEIEHSSVLECFAELEKQGCAIDYLKVDEFGLIKPKDLRELIRPETVLVSVGYANSEIGIIQPIKEIMKEIRHARKELGRERTDYPYAHIDASQAAQYLNMNVEELGVDCMTLDAQKLYGPKGIGALYVRDSVAISPIILGGGQEGGMRSGTENVPLIVGFGKALEIVQAEKERESARLEKIRDEFFDEVKKFVPTAIINGDTKNRLPNNINISIPGEDGELLVLRLDERGIITSSASACASGDEESHTVRKIAEKSAAPQEITDARVASTLRITLGRETKLKHLQKLLLALREICKK
jgi:cysteine desulfurase